MNNLIRAEFRKLRTTQVWFWLLLACVGITALLAIVQLSTRNDLRGNVRDLFTTTQLAFVPAFVLGILGVTTEFRYQTITPTLLATPSRWRLIGAKLTTYALVGALYALACDVVAVAISVPWLRAKGINASFSADDVWTALLGIFLIVILYGLIGLGLGAFLRNQIVAVVLGLIYVLILEGLLSVIPYVQSAYAYLPGGAAAAILQQHQAYGNGDHNHYVSAVAGVFLLLAYAMVLSVLGAAYSMNRDIT